MDINNIFIVIGRNWTKDDIVKELQEEGYKHNFFIGQGQERNILEDRINYSSEVWIFGDATGYPMYEYAKKHKLDIWQMG